jgi:hypothetical protein
MSAPTTKTAYCGKCKRWKSKRDFYADVSRPNGVRGQCKACWRATMRRWNAAKRKRH